MPLSSAHLLLKHVKEFKFFEFQDVVVDYVRRIAALTDDPEVYECLLKIIQLGLGQGNAFYELQRSKPTESKLDPFKEAFDAAWESGKQMSLDEAVAFALAPEASAS